MLYYNKIDLIKGIDVAKSNNRMYGLSLMVF